MSTSIGHCFDCKKLSTIYLYKGKVYCHECLHKKDVTAEQLKYFTGEKNEKN